MPERKIHDVVSLDNGKVEIKNSDNSTQVVKYTKEREFSNLLAIRDWLPQADQLRWGTSSFEVKLPALKSWEPEKSILETEYLEGDNLEEILKSTTGENRGKYVDLIREFINWMERNGIFWGAAAPRHILINHTDKSIGIVDFERSVILNEGGFQHEDFKFLLRSNVAEEFCAFLFEDEQAQVFPDLWDEADHKNVPLESIHGTRLSLLLRELYSPIDNHVSSEQLIIAQKLMSTMVTPYDLDGVPFYPLVYISNTLRGAKNYVKAVLELSNLDKSLWPGYFKNLNK